MNFCLVVGRKTAKLSGYTVPGFLSGFGPRGGGQNAICNSVEGGGIALSTSTEFDNVSSKGESDPRGAAECPPPPPPERNPEYTVWSIMHGNLIPRLSIHYPERAYDIGDDPKCLSEYNNYRVHRYSVKPSELSVVWLCTSKRVGDAYSDSTYVLRADSVASGDVTLVEPVCSLTRKGLL